jgi:hypothetical protein
MGNRVNDWLKGIAAMPVLALSMCATTQQAPLAPCDGWHAIYPTKADVGVISDQLAGQVLSHDLHGQKTCGWTPPGAATEKK